MATSIWTAAVDGDVTDANNWTGSFPGNGDDVIVPATAAGGMNINMAGLADTIASWYVHPGFKFNIGATANPLNVSIAKIVDHGSGEFWFKDDAGISGEFHIRKQAGLVHIDGDTVSNIRVLKGLVYLDAAIGNTAILDVGHDGNVLNDARVVIAVGGQTIAQLNQWGGTVISNAILTNAILAAGTLIQDSDANVAITTLNMIGGQCKYNSTATLGTAYCFGGMLDLLDDAQAKTVTDLWMYPGARVMEDDGEIVTVTNRHILGHGLMSPTGG